MAIMPEAMPIWFASLQSWPVPGAPWRTIVLPIAAKAGWARSKSCCAPPTMMVSVPSRAPRSPPETGASSGPKPFAAASAASERASAGLEVVMSTSTQPGLAADMKPCGPRQTSSTSFG